MYKYIYIFLFTILLVSCTSSKKVHLPDGSVGYEIDCRLDPHGFDGSWADCYNMAGEICGNRGYKVLDKREDHTPTAGNMYIGDREYVYQNVIVDRLLFIKCK